MSSEFPRTPLNAGTLRELVDLDDGQKGLVEEMLGYFRVDGPERIRLIRQALEQGEENLALETAHALKGAAGTIGAWRVKELASEIERACREGRSTQLLAGVDDLEAAYQEAEAALVAFLAE